MSERKHSPITHKPSETTKCFDFYTVTEPPQLAEEPSYFDNFLFPIDKHKFLSEFWAKKCFVSTPLVGQRFQQLISCFLFDLDLESLLETTSSEIVRVWIQNPDGIKEIKSSPEDAKTLYDAGHSLYFRANPDLESLLIPDFCKALGLGASSTFLDGASRGEIETFVSRKGHTTGWHWDFQHNFTLQLSGTKVWTLAQSDIKNPQRGCTPHFRDASTVEQQIKLHKTQSPNFDFEPDFDALETSQVTLKAGSVMYFPPGLWHQVKCTQDSVSINISLAPQTTADYFKSAINHLMMEIPDFRQPVFFESENIVETITANLDQLKSMVEELTVHSLLPEITRLSESHEHAFDFSDFDTEKDLYVHDYTWNPLAKVILKDEYPVYIQEAQEYEFWCVAHFNHGGENFSSFQKVLLSGDVSHETVIRKMLSNTGSEFEQKLRIPARQVFEAFSKIGLITFSNSK